MPNSIFTLATEIRDLSDFILRPWLYTHDGARLCDSGNCNHRSVMIVEGSHMCNGCLAEYNEENEEPEMRHGLSDQEHSERQYNRYGPDGGV